MVDDVNVDIVSAHVHREPRDRSVQRKRRERSLARAYVDRKNRIRFGKRHILPERGKKMRLRKFYAGNPRRFGNAQIFFARKRRAARRHAEERLRAPFRDFLHKIFEKRSGALLRNDFPLPNGKTHIGHVRRFSQKPFRFVSERADFARVFLRCHASRLGQHDPVAEFVDFRRRSPEINRKFYHMYSLPFLSQAILLRSLAAVPPRWNNFPRKRRRPPRPVCRKRPLCQAGRRLKYNPLLFFHSKL